RIAIQLRHTGNAITVTLSDNGPGILAERRELIFQPYYSGKADGTGLGLAIVRQTIEQHHGTISVADTPGGGATFLVQFPV
ncbi:MAG: ATP-binding protein, partial [Gemmatimonadota bacterium]